MAGCHVLLVDDEAALLRLMQTYLTRLGYQVTAVDSWELAVEQLSADGQVEVSIVDLSLMADMQNLVAAARDFPSAHFLICSGRPFEVRSLPKDVQPRFGFLQKPFLPKMLAEAVEHLRGRN